MRPAPGPGSRATPRIRGWAGFRSWVQPSTGHRHSGAQNRCFDRDVDTLAKFFRRIFRVVRRRPEPGRERRPAWPASCAHCPACASGVSRRRWRASSTTGTRGPQAGGGVGSSAPPQPPAAVGAGAASTRARRTRRSRPVGGRPGRTRITRSSPCLRFRGFETALARLLNHRDPRSASRPPTSTRARRTRRSRPVGGRPGRARITWSPPCLSFRGFETALARLLNHRGLRPESRPRTSTRARRTRRSCLSATDPDGPAGRDYRPAFTTGVSRRRWRASSTTGAHGRQAGRERRPVRAVPGVAALSAADPSGPASRGHRPACASGVSRRRWRASSTTGTRRPA